MSKYKGNCANFIDWKYIVDHLEDSILGEVYNGERIKKVIDIDITTDPVIEHNRKTAKIWVESNYNIDSISFKLFRPTVHYDNSVEDILSELLGGRCITSSISKVDPGYTAALHEDSNFNNKITDKIIRYVIFISPPNSGHIFVLENETFSNMTMGDIYSWDHLSQIHGAANISFTPQYLFHIECIEE
jgi:hypothetical protein